MKQNKERKIFVLKKDIVIPAGTEFDNYENKAFEKGYFEGVVGLHPDYSEILSITDTGIFNSDLGIFEEKK